MCHRRGRVFDENANGIIDRHEFSDLIRYCASGTRLTEDEVTQLWDEANELEGDDENVLEDTENIAFGHAFALVCHRHGFKPPRSG